MSDKSMNAIVNKTLKGVSQVMILLLDFNFLKCRTQDTLLVKTYIHLQKF